MEFLYQIHNVGIYINGTNSEWRDRIKANIKAQFDGFEIYNGVCNIEYQLTIQDIKELNQRKNAIVVPECSCSYSDGTIKSEYLSIGYQVQEKQVIMWTAGETWYAPYLLEILFEKQGITFIHGCSVAVDGHLGKLVLAFGGIGKTCFIANAVNKARVTMLGDDLILVSRTGELYSYPRPFCLYEYHKPLFPQYFDSHKVKYVHIEKDMYIKRSLRKLKEIAKIKDSKIYSFLPVSPLKLFSKEKIQITPTGLSDIYIMRRNQAVQTVTISGLNSPQKAANFAIDVILHEWDIGLKVILNHHAQNYTSIIDYIAPRQEILQKAFEQAKNIYCVDIPEKMPATDVSLALNRTILKGID